MEQLQQFKCQSLKLMIKNQGNILKIVNNLLRKFTKEFKVQVWKQILINLNHINRNNKKMWESNFTTSNHLKYNKDRKAETLNQLTNNSKQLLSIQFPRYKMKISNQWTLFTICLQRLTLITLKRNLLKRKWNQHWRP